MVRVKVESEQQGPISERTERAFVFHPTDESYADASDPDALAQLYQQAKAIGEAAYSCQLRIRHALAAMTEGEAKTRRVMGKDCEIIVKMPDDKWEQSLLKEAYNSYPQFRDDYLAVAQLKVKLREFKKLANATGDPAFNMFRDLLTGANNGPSGTPTITIK